MNIVFDIDGTLADCKWRRHLVEGNPRDWDKFMLLSIDDIPNENMKMMYYALNGILNIPRPRHASGDSREVKKFIVTGRMEKYRKITEAWLSMNGFSGYKSLFMRKNEDYRSDHEIKKDILKYMIEEGIKPDLVFDDRDSVVNMWRENGICCFQVDKWVETKDL